MSSLNSTGSGALLGRQLLQRGNPQATKVASNARRAGFAQCLRDTQNPDASSGISKIQQFHIDLQSTFPSAPQITQLQTPSRKHPNPQESQKPEPRGGPKKTAEVEQCLDLLSLDDLPGWRFESKRYPMAPTCFANERDLKLKCEPCVVVA